MVSRNSQAIFIFGILFAVLFGVLFFLFFQQQRLQKEPSQVLEEQQKASEPTSPAPTAPSTPTTPPGPIYGDIGFQGEVKEGPIFVFTDWNEGDEIRTVEVFASAGPSGGTVVFKIASESASLPKPYTLGTVPNGFELVGGRAFSSLDSGKYRVEITALQGGQDITVLHYLNFSE